LLRRFWVIDRRGLAIVEWAAETETEAERELELCAA
jgi:hypothetical protein